MRTMLTIKMPVEKGNQAVKDGTLPRTMEKFMNDFKPEAAYFLPVDGKRTAIMVFDLKDPSHIPAVAEMFFSGLNAEVTMTPVMNADDLKKGLSNIG
jgi:hypothetical protein